MLAIRLQRTGRKGHAQFRLVVQESRLAPTSGRVVAPLGHYNPHTKEVVLDKEKVEFYLKNGARPSDRAARIISHEGVKLPDWVTISDNRTRAIRHSDKLRKNQPKEVVDEGAATEETVPEEVDAAKDAEASATEA